MKAKRKSTNDSKRSSKRKRSSKPKRSSMRKLSKRGTLRRAIREFVPESMFAGLTRHGNAGWSFFTLTLTALFWSWSGEPHLIDRYWKACETLTRWLPGVVAISYQGFAKALASHTASLAEALADHLRATMTRMAGPHEKVAGFVAFAVDGSKVEAPWTAANEKRLGKKGRQPKGENCKRQETDLRPQLSLTLLWHMGLQLPWAWKRGGLDEGERTHFRDMLGLLPAQALVVADAGFVGYDLWRQIVESGRHFLIRVGGNVELLRELCPGSAIEREGDVVHLWPNDKRKVGKAPLRLRLVEVRKGKQKIRLVTSVLDVEKLTDEHAALLYSKRWGIECTFRAFKQTLERRKMKSRTPEHAACELDWSLFAMWLLGLLAKRELIVADQDPAAFSTANAARLLRRDLFGKTHGESIDMSDFLSAVKDTYKRKSSKKARHDQRKKRTKPPGDPRFQVADAKQRKAAKRVGEVVAAMI